MLYKFFENSIASSFIKKLLEDIPLPLYNTIKIGDIVQPGKTYLYKDKTVRIKDKLYIQPKILDNFDENVVAGDVNNTHTLTDSDVSRIKKYYSNYNFFTQSSDIIICNGGYIDISKDSNALNSATFTPRCQALLKRYFAEYDETSSVALGLRVLQGNVSSIDLSKFNTFIDGENLNYKKQPTDFVINSFNFSIAGISSNSNVVKIRVFGQQQSSGIIDPSLAEEIYNMSYEELKESEEYGITYELYKDLTSPIPFTEDLIDKVYTHYTFGEFVNNISNQFINSFEYYDSHTHRTLGNYLRCLRDLDGVDLMPFYNCYSSDNISDISLFINADNLSINVNEKNSRKYKIFAIPIKFNKKYKIYLDCSTQVLSTVVFYNNGIIKNLDLGVHEYLSDKVAFSSIYINQQFGNFNVISGSKFSQPFVFNGISSNITDNEMYPLPDGFDAYSLEKYLYLLIQVPITNHSSLVVIEGDYNDGSCEKGINVDRRDLDENKYIEDTQTLMNRSLISDLELCSTNDSNMYAFSSRLLEYLALNVICPLDKIEHNILGVQRKLDVDTTSIWNTDMQYELYRKYFDLMIYDNIKNKSFNLSKYKLSKYDINGFVDKDMEKLMSLEIFDKR